MTEASNPYLNGSPTHPDPSLAMFSSKSFMEGPSTEAQKTLIDWVGELKVPNDWKLHPRWVEMLALLINLDYVTHDIARHFLQHTHRRGPISDSAIGGFVSYLRKHLQHAGVKVEIPMYDGGDPSIGSEEIGWSLSHAAKAAILEAIRIANLPSVSEDPWPNESVVLQLDDDQAKHYAFGEIVRTAGSIYPHVIREHMTQSRLLKNGKPTWEPAEKAYELAEDFMIETGKRAEERGIKDYVWD